MFYKENIIKGTIIANGGPISNSNTPTGTIGGAGGSGSITIGNISTETFIKDE